MTAMKSHCDASSRGFGGILTQLVNGERRVIAYFSKAVPKHQRHFPSTKLEFLCMHACLMKWKLYLQGAKKFKVFVDCKSLVSFDNLFSRSNTMMQRRLADLQGFNMEIIHISESKNIGSDFLSRYPFENKTMEKSCQTTPLDKISTSCQLQAIKRNQLNLSRLTK